MRITQGYGKDTYSHDDSYAIDLGSVDGILLRAFAPFDAIVRKIYKEDANEVWIESLEPVLYADGTVDYMTMLFMHDNDVSDLYVGKIINQYEEFYQEGTKGQVTGSHIHIECGKGRFDGSGWHQNKTGYWSINNAIPPERALFITSDTNVVNGGGFNWIMATNVTRKYKVGEQYYLNGYIYLDSFGNSPGGSFINEYVTITDVSFNEKATKPYLLNNGNLGWVGEDQLTSEPIKTETEVDKLQKQIVALQDTITLKEKQIEDLKQQLKEQEETNDLKTFTCTKSGSYYIKLLNREVLYYRIQKEQEESSSIEKKNDL